MPRRLTPTGRRVVVPVRVSEDTARQIDAARGEVSRSEWLHRAALAALSGQPPAAAPPVRQPAASTAPQAPAPGHPHAGHQTTANGTGREHCSTCGTWYDGEPG